MKLTEYPSASTLTGTEILPVTQSGTQKKTTAQAIAALTLSPATSLTIAPAGSLSIQPAGSFTLTPSGSITMTPAGSLNLNPTGSLNAFGQPLLHNRLTTTSTVAGTFTIDAGNYDIFQITAACSLTNIVMTNLKAKRYVFKLMQDATGGRTITLGNQFVTGSDVGSYTGSTIANKVDFVICQCDGTSLYVVGIHRGY